MYNPRNYHKADITLVKEIVASSSRSCFRVFHPSHNPSYVNNHHLAFITITSLLCENSFVTQTWIPSHYQLVVPGLKKIIHLLSISYS